MTYRADVAQRSRIHYFDGGFHEAHRNGGDRRGDRRVQQNGQERDDGHDRRRWRGCAAVGQHEASDAKWHESRERQYSHDDQRIDHERKHEKQLELRGE